MLKIKDNRKGGSIRGDVVAWGATEPPAVMPLSLLGVTTIYLSESITKLKMYSTFR